MGFLCEKRFKIFETNTEVPLFKKIGYDIQEPEVFLIFDVGFIRQFLIFPLF